MAYCYRNNAQVPIKEDMAMRMINNCETLDDMDKRVAERL